MHVIYYPKGDISHMKRDLRYLFIFVFIILLIILNPFTSNAYSSRRRNISIEPKWGYYVFDTSKWGTERGYGGRYSILGAIKTNLEFFHQIIQLGGGIGFLREDKPHYFLYNIPIELSLNLRFKFTSEQLIVPYLGGGVDYSYFKEKSRYRDNQDIIRISIIHVNRKGYHMNAGVQLLLDRFDNQSARRFDEKFGINATYLTIEARYTDLTDFGDLESEKTDVSGWFYTMGLLFEF